MQRNEFVEENCSTRSIFYFAVDFLNIHYWFRWSRTKNGMCFVPKWNNRGQKKDKEGEKSTDFTPTKAVAKRVSHLSTLLGPPSFSSLIPPTSWRAERRRGPTHPFILPEEVCLPLRAVKNINCRSVVKTRKAKGRDVKCHISP